MFITICILLIFLLLLCYLFYIYNFRRLLRNLAIDIINAFNDNDINYWVDFGTLLGIIRDNDIIIGDTDVDICVINYPENIKKIEKALKQLTNQGYITKRMTDWNAYRVYYFYDYLYADIYINNMDDNKKEFIGATGETSNISYNLIGNIQYIMWNDINVKIPEKIHDTLVWRYGQDYMIPKNSKGRNI